MRRAAKKSRGRTPKLASRNGRAAHERPSAAATKGSVAAGKAAVKTISANRFVLKDSAGRTRGLFECAPDGTPSWRLLDKDGTVRLSIILREGSPGIEFVDGNRVRRMLLYLRPQDKETADLVYLNNSAKPTLGITTTHRDAILLEGHDSLGNLVEPIWFARDLHEEHSPYFNPSEDIEHDS